MPKENFRNGDATLTVGWWSSEKVQNGQVVSGEYVGDWIDFSIGVGKEFTFVDDPSQTRYTALHFQLSDRTAKERFVRSINRAGKQVFANGRKLTNFVKW